MVIRVFPLVILFFCIGTVSIFGQEADLEESMLRGEMVYMDFCVTCHLEDGKGVANTFPPLAQSDYLKNNREASIRGIKYGQQGEMVVNGVTYNNVMAPMGLDDSEIADVMNYILNSWGNWSDHFVTTDEVARVEK
ncbi:c-type cytochrome [Euzebyella saccharophila]|uniref:C-type cytochrome n=1 Tax=Euzebyella saccharophila TaxID=679664 RepID=A0ABV8JWG3_9FLAO|nr:cytochrome c [Euzebyella saccharophila]